MAPLPYANSGARIAFYIPLVVFALLELRLRLRTAVNRQGVRSDRGSFFVIYISIVAAMLGGFALAGVHGAAIRAARWPIFVVGVALMATGIAIRQWAILLLGKLFTTDVRVHSDQQVIDSGPYRWVRHPSYTGLLMIFAGIGLALGNWAALAALLLLPASGLVYRIRVEERALAEGLGEPYRRFAAGRARLVPRVW